MNFNEYQISNRRASAKGSEQDLIEYLEFLKFKGLEINIVYDIGAWMGYWSPLIKNRVFPNAEFIMFEANSAYVPNLQASGFRHFNVLLSNPERDFVEFFNGTNSGDSYYKETSVHYDNQSSIKLPCITLDKLIKDNNLPYPNFIKIDTQGSELDILKGAKSILEYVDIIYVECPICTYNTGAPDIGEYLKFFKEHKFLPVQLVEQHVTENTLIQVDIMFMRVQTKERILGNNTITRPWG